jgi:peptide/nickel transport system substrate-binding protein
MLGGGLALANSACGVRGGSITIGLNDEPITMDPALSGAVVDREVLQNIYAKLIDTNAKSQLVPDLATSWSVSDGGKTFTLHLRSGVVFQDGTPFNAQAVKFNLERDLTLKGSVRVSEVNDISSIKVLSPLEVQINLKAPFSQFLYVLTGRTGMMVSPTAAKKWGNNYALHPVGAGPFRFVEHIPQDKIVLARNPHYYAKGEPCLNQVVYKFFINGSARLANLLSNNVQMVYLLDPSTLSEAKANPAVVIKRNPFGWQGIYLNMTKPPFNNLLLRQALADTISRRQLIQVALDGAGVPAFGPIFPGNYAYPGIPAPHQNIAEAKALLKKAGMPGGFTFTLKTATGSANALEAQVIQSMAAQAGIQVKIDQVNFGTLLSQERALDYQGMALGWSGRPWPDGNIYAFVTTGGSFNEEGYSNPKVDSLLNQARTTSSAARQKQLYGQAERILVQQLPIIFLYYPTNLLAYRNTVTNYSNNPDSVIRLTDVWLK